MDEKTVVDTETDKTRSIKARCPLERLREMVEQDRLENESALMSAIRTLKSKGQNPCAREEALADLREFCDQLLEITPLTINAIGKDEEFLPRVMAKELRAAIDRVFDGYVVVDDMFLSEEDVALLDHV